MAAAFAAGLIVPVTAACSSSPSASGPKSSPVAGQAFGFATTQGIDSAGMFDAKYTCDTTTDYSPGFKVSSVPAGTAELALTMVDLDDGKVHWLQVGIPAASTDLKPHALAAGAREILNDIGEATYDGPCPPHGATHKYQITLYALPGPASASLGSGMTPTETLHALESKASATAQLSAAYTRHA